MDVVSKTSEVEDIVTMGSDPISTHHGTPLVGTSRRIRVGLERGGVPWVNVEILRIPGKEGTRQFECSIVQLVGIPGCPEIVALETRTLESRTTRGERRRTERTL
jgi:hypothetical protein